MIHRDDFRFMRKGKAVGLLSEKEERLLSPVWIEHQSTRSHKKALLILHGFASTPAIFRALIPHIKGYDALHCPVLPGHAESLDAFSSITHQAWLDAAHQYASSLIQSYEHVDIIGLSLGGLLAYHTARKLPIKTLYLLAPAFKLKFNMSLATILAHVLNAFGIDSVKNRAGNMFTPKFDELGYKVLPIHAILELFTLIKNTNYDGLPCKTHLFLGRHDTIVDSVSVEKRLTSHPKKTSPCKVHWLEQSSHAIPLDGDIETIIKWVNQS